MIIPTHVVHGAIHDGRQALDPRVSPENSISSFLYDKASTTRAALEL